MYDDTLSFFAKLYGEDTQETQPAEVAEDTAEAQDASDDTSMTQWEQKMVPTQSE